MRDFLGAPLGGVKINDFCWGKLFLKSSKIYRIFFYLLENYFVNIIKKKLTKKIEFEKLFFIRRAPRRDFFQEGIFPALRRSEEEFRLFLRSFD